MAANSFPAPEFFSIAPPLMDFESELIWFDLTQSYSQKVEYDKSSRISTNTRELMELAFTQPLNLQDQKLLLNELAKNPFFVYQIRLTPDKVSKQNRTCSNMILLFSVTILVTAFGGKQSINIF